MELIIRNRLTAPLSYDNHSNIAKCSFNKRGAFILNRAAVQKLNLKPGDKISIAQEKNELRNCYIYKDSNGFELRVHKSSKQLLFSNKATLVETLESVGYDTSVTHCFLISSTPTVFNKVPHYGILIPA